MAGEPLRTYPIPSEYKGKLEDGREYEFELQQWCNNKETLDGIDTFVQMYKDGTWLCESCYIIAIPQLPEESEDELWGEVVGIVIKADTYRTMNLMIEFKDEMQKLNSFTLTRKKQ